MHVNRINNQNILNNNIYILKKNFKEKIKLELLNNPFGEFLILNNDDNIIGFIYYSDIYERVEINQFEIFEKFRNMGYGKYLLTYLIKKVNKNITLEVNENNFIAIKLYKSMGFLEKAVRNKYYGKENGILMERVVKWKIYLY